MVSTRNKRKSRKQRGGEGNSNLPHGWNIMPAEDGKQYYYHAMTNRYRNLNNKPTINSEIKHYKNRKSTYDPESGLALLNSKIQELGSLNAAKVDKMKRISSLPSGWLELTNPEGNLVYYNPSTKALSNTIPSA